MGGFFPKVQVSVSVKRSESRAQGLAGVHLLRLSHFRCKRKLQRNQNSQRPNTAMCYR